MTNTKLKLYILALLIALFPHFTRLPVWVMVWCAVLWGYILWREKYKWPIPHPWIRRTLTAVGIFGVLAHQGMSFSGDFYISLMAIMAGLKPLEIESYRDGVVTLFVAYFIVITSVFVSESLFVTAYMFLSICFTTGVLIFIHQQTPNLKPSLILSAKLITQAMPLMLVLFLLFPRIRAGLWGFNPSQTGRTGFSGTLTLGDITRLTQDDSVVFKVEFEGTAPPYSNLYWRGLVFDEFDGRQWRSSGSAIPWQKNELQGDQRAVYHIALEPHGHRWLFALDLPVSKPSVARLLSDYTLRTRYFVKKRFHYRVESLTRYNTGELETWEKNSYQLPLAGNPKARALAQTFAKESLSDQQIIDKALAYFKQGGFVYTLNPPLLGSDPIDGFLFNTKKGYCEHFAASFVFLMRAAGIPARIVAGYFGGRQNPFGGYMTILQKDAHAWSEVYLDRKGWVRIDPTAVIAPQQMGSQSTDDLAANQSTSGVLSLWPAANELVRQFKLRWDYINYKWDIWFSGYSYIEQQGVLGWLGITYRSIKGWLKIAAFILMTVLLPVVSIRFWYHRKAGAVKDRPLLAYEKFCLKMSRIGVKRNPSQGPFDYYRTIITQKPGLKLKVHDIIMLYIKLRYSNHGTKQEIKLLEQAVGKFQPEI